jgi:eukaryotic-like serine/threonine-protein kinase
MPPTPRNSVVVDVPARPFEYEAGTIIAQRYRLEAPIGFGGMGTVWRAHNELLDSPVAIKLLSSTVHRSGSSERLLLEAKAAACVHHPAIIRVYDFGLTEHGDPFLAMELLKGESLRDLLEREDVMPAQEAVRMLLPVLGGLSCAHARGIVHRDLKPDNIFLARDDAGCVEPKVVDFGIAMFEGLSSRLTTAGVILGSPSYMSPEQAMGDEDIDMRADVWASAVVLYEAIAGRPPWEATNCPALLRAIVDDAPSPLIGRGGVDAELWAVIELALAKRCEDRWASTREFGRALALWLARRGVTDDVSGTSLKTTWLSKPESGRARGSLASIPPISTSPTLERGVAPPRTRKRLQRITLGVGIPLAAALMLFQVGFRPSRTPDGPSVAAGGVTTELPASRPSSRPATEVSGQPPPPSTTINVSASARVRPAERPSTARPSVSSSGHLPVGKVPLARHGSARTMDFGF